MPKQVWKIERFEGGLNTNSDPRDLKDNELVAATDAMVDKMGRVTVMGTGKTVAGVLNDTSQTYTSNEGYGLFYFPHDRRGAQVQGSDFTGSHTGSSNSSSLTDSSASFPTDALIGFTINNTTDGSSGTITDNTSVGVTATLSGGTDDDWDGGDAYTITNAPESGDNYLLLADCGSAANIDVYSDASNVWESGRVDLGSTTGMKPCFYMADGNLRVSDGAFGAANRNKWFGHIQSTHFSGISPEGTTDSYDRWYTRNLDLAAPTRGISGIAVAFTDTTTALGDSTIYIEGVNLAGGGASTWFASFDIDNQSYIAVSTTGSENARIITEVHSGNNDFLTEDNSGDWSGEAIEVYPPVGTGWNVYLRDNTSTAGTWEEGDYEVATTFIYQGGQESKIFTPHRSLTRGEQMESGNSWDVKIFATSPYDPFIIGGRVYIRKADEPDPWVLLADISLEEGVRTDLTSNHTAWKLRSSDDSQHNNAPDNAYCYVEIDGIASPSPWTYEAINGYAPDEPVAIGLVGEGFKTAVVANRQVYIGNVKRTGTDGVLKKEGDVMYKSMPGKFDTFPIARKIEASVQDGDSIIKLEEYADRILQFKRNKMHLINISQNIEFLEDTFMHKGVAHPAAVCKTDFGVAWVNKFGCYFYNGEKVENLIEKQGSQIIDSDTWATFTANSPMIAFLPKKRQLIVVDDMTSSGDGDIFLYDMVTSSWVQGTALFESDGDLTNIVNDWNGDLIYANGNTLYDWTSSPTLTTNFSLKTKDIDFGQPGIRKKVYRVRISYKGDADSLTVKYSINGDTDTLYNFNGTNSDGTHDGSADATPLRDKTDLTLWSHAELKPATSSVANNIYSFQIHMDGEVDSDFELNDMSIIYRVKNIK